MKKSFALFAVAALLFISVNSRAQGIRASVQTGHYGIEAPFWLGNKVSLAPAVSVLFSEANSLDMMFGLVPRFYLKDPTALAPYVGLSAGVALYKDYTSATSTMLADIVGGLSFGGEYFFDESFSMGTEAQLNVTKSNSSSLRFSNPGGININTAAAVSATVYFGR